MSSISNNLSSDREPRSRRNTSIRMVAKWVSWFIVATFLSILCIKWISNQYSTRVLVFDFSCDRSGWLQVFFDRGAGLSQEDSVLIYRHDHETSPVEIPISEQGFLTFRIDPTMEPGVSFKVGNILIRNGWGSIKSKYHGKLTAYSIDTTDNGEGASVQGTSTGIDPMVALDQWSDYQGVDDLLIIRGIIVLAVLIIMTLTWCVFHYVKRPHLRFLLRYTSIDSLFFLILLLTFLFFQKDLIFGGFLSFLSNRGLDDKTVTLQVYFLLFLCLSWITGYLFIRKRSYGFFPKLHAPKSSSIRSIWPRDIERELLLILILAFFVRAYFLAQPMRYDEAFTYINFVGRSWWRLFYYPVPNNHLLHTILVKLTTIVFGTSEFTVRLPAFACGVSNVALVYIIARKEFGKLSAIWASTLQALCPFVILFDCMARGYSLFTFILLVIIYLLQKWNYELTRGRIYWISVLFALGMYTIPTFVLPLTGVYLFVLWNLFTKFRCYEALKHSIASFSAVGILTFSFYAPVFLRTQSFSRFLSNKTVVNPHPETFFSYQLPHHFQKISDNFFRDIYPQFVVFLAVMLLVGIIYHLIRRKSRLINLLLTILAGAIAVFLLKKTIPAPRLWLFVPPMLFMIQSYVLQLPVFNRRFVTTVTLISITVASLLFSIDLVGNQRIAKYQNTGYLPELKYALDFLYRKGAKPEKIRCSYFPGPMIKFYNREFSELIEENSYSDSTYWIIGKPRFKIESFVEDKDTELLMQIGNCRVYEVLENSQKPER